MKRIVFLAGLLLLCPMAYGQDRLAVNITESGKVISYFDMFWVANVEGAIYVHNPLNTSFDFLRFTYDLGPLTIVEDNATDYIKPGYIYIPYIDSGETIEFSYTIRGILGYDPMLANRSVMHTGLYRKSANLYAFMESNIRKADIENITLDTEGIKSVKGRRLVTVMLNNPTDLYQNVTSVDVIKTLDRDPNAEIESWHFPADASAIIIPPRSSWHEDILDYNASDGEVYWLSVEAQTDTVPLITGRHTIKRFTQDDLFIAENGTLLESENLTNVTDYLEHLMYVKKSVSKATVVPGDLSVVSVQINNFAPVARYVYLTEKVPSGFAVTDPGGANRSTNGVLTWLEKINPDSVRTFQYKLTYEDNFSLGLDYFEPAVVRYLNETLYSRRIPFVRQYIPEKRVFIQKKLSYTTDSEVKVSLALSNLGESAINDLYVKEFLGAQDVFREISQVTESKGRWHVPALAAGETWVVTYITNENPSMNLLPEVYGVDRQLVLKTLVFENTVRNEWLMHSIRLIEIAAPLFVLGFIVFYIVYLRRLHSAKVRKVKTLAGEIHRLRAETDPGNREKIDVLKRETKTASTVPAVAGPNVPPGALHRNQGKSQDLAHENLEKLKRVEEESR